MPGLIGKKIGMTSIFSPEGKNLPCTVLEVGPCVVTHVDFNGGSTRLILLKVFSIKTVEGVKITLHIDEENSHINQLFPARTTSLKDALHILKYAVHLGLEIEGLEVAIVVKFQSGNAAIVGVAAGGTRPHA